MTDWCSWWFEGQWAYCCYEHDFHILGDWGLAKCMATSPAGYIVGSVFGVITFVGLKLFGWVYRWKQSTKTPK